GPLRDRFGAVYRLDYYSADELATIVRRSAGILNVDIEEDAVQVIARRGRGTPRIVNRLLRRVRDYAQVRSEGRIGAEEASAAMNVLTPACGTASRPRVGPKPVRSPSPR